MAIADRHGLPVACCVTSASPHETKLVEATIEQRFTRAKPERMIGDRAYDSDPLDQRLRQKHGHSAHRAHKYKPPPQGTQDGRELRPLLSTLENRAPLCLAPQFPPTREPLEYHEANFLGMLQLGCLIILLRHL